MSADTLTKDETIRVMQAEIDQLRGELDRAERVASLTVAASSVAGEALRKMDKADAEIERLRGLLREGIEHHDEYNWQQRVREALGND